MAFQDSFSANLAAVGVPVDPSLVPDRATLDADLDALASWLFSLEDETRSAIDDVTASNMIQAMLADKSVGIVSAIGPVLAGFDEQPSSIAISTSLEMMRTASQNAKD